MKKLTTISDVRLFFHRNERPNSQLHPAAGNRIERPVFMASAAPESGHVGVAERVVVVQPDPFEAERSGWCAPAEEVHPRAPPVLLETFLRAGFA